MHPQHQQSKNDMGRKKIHISYIENDRHRQVGLPNSCLLAF